LIPVRAKHRIRDAELAGLVEEQRMRTPVEATEEAVRRIVDAVHPIQVVVFGSAARRCVVKLELQAYRELGPDPAF